MLVNGLLELISIGSSEGVDLLTVLVEHEGRHSTHSSSLCSIFGLINVDLEENHYLDASYLHLRIQQRKPPPWERSYRAVGVAVGDDVGGLTGIAADVYDQLESFLPGILDNLLAEEASECRLRQIVLLLSVG